MLFYYSYLIICTCRLHLQSPFWFDFIKCEWCVILFFQAEKKHKSFQELDRFMHYYTRFKNHEHSYQVNRHDSAFVTVCVILCTNIHWCNLWKLIFCKIVSLRLAYSNAIYCNMMRKCAFSVFSLYLHYKASLIPNKMCKTWIKQYVNLLIHIS